jgi:hypothetical protein
LDADALGAGSLALGAGAGFFALALRVSLAGFLALAAGAFVLLVDFLAAGLAGIARA